MSYIDQSKLSDIKYWLEGIAGNSSVTPVVQMNSFIYYLFIYTFASFVTIAIILFVSNQFLNNRNPLKSKLPFLANNLFWMGVLGLVWFMMRQTQVGFLGARIWLIIGFCWFTVIMFFTLRYIIRSLNLEMRYYSKLKSSLNLGKK